MRNPPYFIRTTRLGGFCHLSLHQPVCQPYHIRRMDAEEDVQDLRLLSSGFHPPQRVVFLLRTERSLHHRGPHPRQLPSHHVLFVLRPIGARPHFGIKSHSEASNCVLSGAAIPNNVIYTPSFLQRSMAKVISSFDEMFCSRIFFNSS